MQPTQYESNNTEADIFFVDGLADFRADLKIYESIIINFFACDDNTIFLSTFYTFPESTDMWQTNTSFPPTYLDNRNNPMYTGCSPTAGNMQSD